MTGPGSAVERAKKPGEKGALSTTNGKGSITELLHLAVEKGTPVEQLAQLVELHEKMEAREAAKEFAIAMAAFQQECPSIYKSKTAKITTQGGGSYSYSYAELDHIARTVNPILAKYGLSYSWDTAIDKGFLTCICTVRHLNGHKTESRFSLPTESKSAMSEQQKYGAALTFAQRRSLSSALGLTTTDEDSEAAPDADPTPITDDQVIELEDLIAEVKADRGRFLKFLGVEELAQLPAVRYKEAIAALSQKKGKGGAR